MAVVEPVYVLADLSAYLGKTVVIGCDEMSKRAEDRVIVSKIPLRR